MSSQGAPSTAIAAARPGIPLTPPPRRAPAPQINTRGWAVSTPQRPTSSLRTPTSVRSTGERPWAVAVEPERRDARIAELVAEEVAAVGPGRVAVIAPAARLDDVYAMLDRSLARAVSRVENPTALDSAATVLTVSQAKGLEFDTVLIVEPAEILAESARGATDLYVAVTRPTQRLGMIHTAPLPDIVDTSALGARSSGTRALGLRNGS